jgi:ATP-dependent Clp protease ATP-binding subunit ClpA
LGVSEKIVKDGIETTQAVVKHNDPADVVEARILAGVQAHFKNTINRPELLNRIGDNILVFQFIGGSDRNKIADKFLQNVSNRMIEKGIRLTEPHWVCRRLINRSYAASLRVAMLA